MKVALFFPDKFFPRLGRFWPFRVFFDPRSPSCRALGCHRSENFAFRGHAFCFSNLFSFLPSVVFFFGFWFFGRVPTGRFFWPLFSIPAPVKNPHPCPAVQSRRCRYFHPGVESLLLFRQKTLARPSDPWGRLRTKRPLPIC